MKQFEAIRQRWKTQTRKKQVQPLRLKREDLYLALLITTWVLMAVFFIAQPSEAGSIETNDTWNVVYGKGAYQDDVWHQTHLSRYVGELQFKGDCIGRTSSGECSIKLFSYYNGQLANCHRPDGGEWSGWIKGISRWNPLDTMEGTVPCNEVLIRVNPLVCSSFTYCTQVGSGSDSVFRTHYLDGPCPEC